VLAPCAPDRLPRLTDCLGGHRARVDQNRVGEAGVRRLRTHYLRFDGVQPAAEGEDVDLLRRIPS
jgi:hypothetical protein